MRDSINTVGNLMVAVPIFGVILWGIVELSYVVWAFSPWLWAAFSSFLVGIVLVAAADD